MKMIVYLCGSLNSGWQDKVKEAVPEAEYRDPRERPSCLSSTPSSDPKDYTRRDIESIYECKILLAYLEKSGPGRMNLAFEIGVASGMDMSGHAKLIILADESSSKNQDGEMIRASSDIVTSSLDEAIACLRKYVPPYLYEHNHHQAAPI